MLAGYIPAIRETTTLVNTGYYDCVRPCYGCIIGSTGIP